MLKLKDICVDTIIKVNDLTIEEKAVTCVIGQSGSGKSTFLRLLNNLDDPSKGEVYYQDTPFHKMDPIQLRRKITMIPQTPVIFEGTIRENLQIGLKFSEKEVASDDDLQRVMQMMELDKGVEEDAENLSGGEKQRLALARNILLDATVFLLDEPTSALDDTTASHVIQNFVDYGKQKDKTIIMVTHDQDLAKSIADHFIHMDHYSQIIKEKEAKHG